jgi:prepilin-type processing-associated H-X9-DG protein
VSWGSARNPGDNGGNYAYADGHVEFIPLKQLNIWRAEYDPYPPYPNPVNAQAANQNPWNGYNNYSTYDDHWKWHKL